MVVVDYDVALATSWLCMYKFRGAGSKEARGAIAPSDFAGVEKRKSRNRQSKVVAKKLPSTNHYFIFWFIIDGRNVPIQICFKPFD